MPHAGPPRKALNATRRSREYLTPREVDALIAAARRLGRHGHRDVTMVLLAYRHGLRVSELVALRWSRSTSRAASSMSAGGSMGWRPRIPSTALKFGRCGR